jgi:hypothetical protein
VPAAAVVLNRNTSGNRLRADTELPDLLRSSRSPRRGRPRTRSRAGEPRSIQDTLKRMVAHAGRTHDAAGGDPLRPGPLQGRQRHLRALAGDDVSPPSATWRRPSCATATSSVATAARSSSSCCPTRAWGAVVVAEKLRAAIANVHVASVDRALWRASASR